MRLTKNEMKELEFAIKRLGITFNEGIKLKKYSINLQKIGIRECNGFISARSKEWNKTRKENIISEINTLLAKYGNKFYFFHQTDPRGAQVYIIDLENKDFNNKYSDWIAKGNFNNKLYYGDNLYIFFNIYYTQFGIVF